MLNLILKDGSVLEVENGCPAFEAAKKLSEGLARNALAATNALRPYGHSIAIQAERIRTSCILGTAKLSDGFAAFGRMPE